MTNLYRVTVVLPERRVDYIHRTAWTVRRVLRLAEHKFPSWVAVEVQKIGGNFRTIHARREAERKP